MREKTRLKLTVQFCLLPSCTNSAGHVIPGDCNVARALKITRKEKRSHRNVPVHGEFVEGSEQAHFDGVCKDMRSILIEVAWKMECEGP